MLRQLIKLVVLGLVCVGLVGCGGAGGPKLTPVKGKVTLDGQPLAGATVNFMPETGPVALGVTDAGGNYTLNTVGRAGAVEGKHRVGITKSITLNAVVDPKPEDMARMLRDGKMPTAKSVIPPKYAAPQTSGLERTVTADRSKNVFDFDLTP